jgi:tRNA modification GTPase
MGLAGGHEQRFSVRARHLETLAQAAACLHGIFPESPPDLIAEDLRLAERALEQLLGRGDHEALLGAIFAGFCIGK